MVLYFVYFYTKDNGRVPKSMLDGTSHATKNRIVTKAF